MQAQSVVAFTLLASALIACTVTPRDTEAVGQNAQALLPRGSEPLEPRETTPPPPPHSCPSQRIDLLRETNACVLPPASTQGTWSLQPLFPNAPLSIKNRLCAYTWQPKDTTGTCAAPPISTIARASNETLALRGHCPLGTTGCTTTYYTGYNDQPVLDGAYAGGLVMSKSDGTSSSSGGTTAVQKQTTTSPTSTSSSTSSSSGNIVVPNGGVGCCDTCAEVRDRRAWIVLPENYDYSRIYIDVPYDNFSNFERIYLNTPDTNVIEVSLNPSVNYDPGMLPFGAHTEW